MMRRSILLLSAFPLIAVACTSGGGEQASSSPTGTSSPVVTSSPAAPTALPSSLVSFAPFRLVPLMDPDSPRYAGLATPSSLDGVQIAPEVRRVLRDPAIAAALTKRGFVVVPSDLRLFHFAYQGNVYGGWPVFVTTDAAYHTWHLVFDKVLRSLEQEVLLPKLGQLVDGLLAAASAQADELRGTALEDAGDRVEQLYEVAAAELGRSVTLGTLAAQEKALVDAHSEAKSSPIVGSMIDYSIFTPRGHYTRNEDLTRYFVTMSVLGQLAFCLPGTSDCPGLDPTRMAILASRVLTADPSLVELWRQIYEPTAFLVGIADDYTPLEVADAARSVAPGGLEDASAFADDQAVLGVVDALRATRPVRINPDRASIRLMGARFVIDSFILDQLIYPNVGTGDEPRDLPSALDLAAAFGSDYAHGILDSIGETGYANYDRQLAAMQEEVASRPDVDWGGTVYDAWLSALQPEFVEHGRAFPDFMRSSAWGAKAQQSGLGSFAELKHDTILYSKQAVAEGGDEVPIPERRNWVEPEPVIFERLAATAALLREGLDQRELLTSEQDLLLSDLGGLLEFLGRVARDELAGTPISERDNDRLTSIGHELEAFYTRTADQTAGGESELDQDAAIVADIASGGGKVLEIGTGRVDRIYVLVPDDHGTFQVAVGGVYSYYEFAGPQAVRLTDEEWRSMLDSGEAPARPAWEDAMLAG